MLHDPELHYLDNAATTIVAPEVADVIDKAMREHWANPSSLYAPGARSEEALNAARAAVARTLGCKSKELYFTSCGSESNNLALLGAVRTRTFGKGIVVSGFEHPSVQKPLERLAAMGYDVTVVDPGPDGTLDIDRMLDHVDKNTILVACMMVNNEVGTRNDVERLAAEVKRRNSRTIVHVDAVQAWMRVPIKLANIDTLAVSGHKIHAPKGIGALYLSDSLYQAFQAPYLGGEQEREKRPGTENLPYAMGLAAAAARRVHAAALGTREGAQHPVVLVGQGKPQLRIRIDGRTAVREDDLVAEGGILPFGRTERRHGTHPETVGHPLLQLEALGGEARRGRFDRRGGIAGIEFESEAHGFDLCGERPTHGGRPAGNRIRNVGNGQGFPFGVRLGGIAAASGSKRQKSGQHI